MKRLIVILGMRSGSSVTTRISQCMGAYLGEDNELLGASSSNPDGHFENLEIVRIDKSILHCCDKEWYSLETPVPDYDNMQIKEAMEGIRDVIEALFKKSDLVAVKDPRICLLMPLWGEILKEMEIEIRYIWVYRNPLEVMESLRKRNGYSSRHCLLLWIRYNLSVLKYLQGKEYLLINYRDILEQTQVLEKMSRLFGREFDDALKCELKHIIKGRYCHTDYSYDDVKNLQDELLSDLYGALLENREGEADVSEWEKRYQTEMARTEPKFLDYGGLEDPGYLENRDVIIYGAGKYGVRAAEMLDTLGIPKYNFCDKDVSKHGMNLMNGRVLSIAEIEKLKAPLVIIAIQSQVIRKEVEETLAYIERVTFLPFSVLKEKACRAEEVSAEGNRYKREG